METTTQRVNGLLLSLTPTSMFKTRLIHVHIDRPSDEKNGLLALLANVLGYGSMDYPNPRCIASAWAELYGANFSMEIDKIGTRQVLQLKLVIPEEMHIAGQPSLLRQGLGVIASLLLNPLVHNGCFRPEIVAREKASLLRTLSAAEQQNAQYSWDRCIEVMCAGEPYCFPVKGSTECIRDATPETLYTFYTELLTTASCRIFLVGDFGREEAVNAVCDVFAWHGTPPASTQYDTKSARPSPSLVLDERPVSQACLTMGFRYAFDHTSYHYPALLVYNALLGDSRFSHTKLFRNVREQAGLAYYCRSELIAPCGLMMLYAGVSNRMLGQAYQLISQQVADISNGNFTDDDLAIAIRLLQNWLRAVPDKQQRIAAEAFEQMLLPTQWSRHSLVRSLGMVKRNDVMRVAEQISLDTLHVLCNSAGKESISSCRL